MAIHAQQSYVNDAIPVGSIIQYAGNSAPEKWLICDGSSFSSTTYPKLATVVQDSYGLHSGTTYYLPNFKGKVPVGLDSAQTEFNFLGKTGGSKTSTASHTHDINHDHGSFNATSGTESASHNHTVAINHDHASFNATSGGVSANHTHSIGDGRYGYSNSAGGNFVTYLLSSTGGSGAYGPSVTNTQSADHTHTTAVDVPAFTGNSSSVGNESVTHTHITAIDVPALGTTASGDSSTTLASGNLQPYIVINYIIRAE